MFSRALPTALDEGLFSDDAFAFLDSYELPRGDFGEILGFAIEPADR
jgi:hypothetical protein